MNRRAFLISLGAAACGASAARRPQRARERRDDGRHIFVGEGMLADRSFAQVLRTPIAVSGDVLVRHRDGRLVFFDANTFATVGSADVPAYTFCFLQNGSVAAYVQPHDAKRCEIHVIDQDHNVRVYWGPELAHAADAEMVPGRASDEIFLSDDNNDIVRLQLRPDGEARATGRIKPDLTPWKRLRQLVSLGDGRVVTRGGRALLVQEPGRPTVTYATPDEIVWHVAGAGGPRLWYSYGVSEHPDVVDGIALAALGDALSVQTRIGFAPETVAHLASSAGALAVLTANPPNAAVLVFDADGKQRWRAEIPAAFYAPDRFPDAAWVAMSNHRVIVYGPHGALMSWDAATGARVGTM